jgi:hypothetical protein
MASDWLAAGGVSEKIVRIARAAYGSPGDRSRMDLAATLVSITRALDSIRAANKRLERCKEKVELLARLIARESTNR